MRPITAPSAPRVEARLLRNGDEFHVPHLVDVEVVQGLRRLERTGEVSSARAKQAIEDLIDLDRHRHSHTDLMNRAWTPRDDISVYDARYVTSAETLDAPLVTCDGPLSTAPGHSAR